jgi:cardiolipin synthase A/B
MISIQLDYISAAIIIVLYLAGFALSLNALFQSRTPQGTMAWILALTCIPFLAVPIFLLFGKKRIENYDRYEEVMIDVRRKIEDDIAGFRVGKESPRIEKFLIHSNIDFIRGNKLKLLLDGKETFNEMLDCIKSSENYIFLQMYIFRTDKIGTVFTDVLKKKAREGVKVFVLYERLGIRMSKSILKEMKEAGVWLGEFSPVRINKLQVNFRNHRKLLIIDGSTGFFGGINIGDDYLGRYPSIGYWRDTNVKIQGPVVSLAQIDFIKDWKFSQKEEIEINLAPPIERGDSDVLLINSGPAEERPLNLLNHIEIINSARKRLWIANPYIVPPQGIMDALFIAAIRGIDVRVIVPQKSDNGFVALAMEVYLERLVKAGIRVYKYQKGMLHQKVILLDDMLAVIGSSNIDFRSMYINFENSIVTDDPEFIKDLDLAVRRDIDFCLEVGAMDFKTAPLKHKLASHLANSVAPIL